MHFNAKSAAALVAGLLYGTMPTHAGRPLATIIAQGSPVIDLRARYETVDDKSKAFDGNAETLRARLAYETGT